MADLTQATVAVRAENGHDTPRAAVRPLVTEPGMDAVEVEALVADAIAEMGRPRYRHPPRACRCLPCGLALWDVSCWKCGHHLAEEGI